MKAPTQEIDPIRQDIMRHLKVDRLAVDLVKDSLFMLDKEPDTFRLEKLREMFSAVLRFLTLFVTNNPTNQASLSEHITSLLADLQTDIG